MRPLDTIAAEIHADWGSKLSPHAKPYVDAMYHLTSINDKYIHDDGRDVVLRFLVNASYWKGETARRIKAELKDMLTATASGIEKVNWYVGGTRHYGTTTKRHIIAGPLTKKLAIKSIKEQKKYANVKYMLLEDVGYEPKPR